ncbi:PepSY domain-containing protein [Brevundimonas sp. SL161]|uniref:PepSY domain-containing protein n=1 Tax=Brevundimonas sp. SL161 TaxID=2804613 RepID=UPI003CF0C10F
MNNFLIPSAVALSLAVAVGVAMSFATTASAGPVCTTAPRAQWLAEAQMRTRVAQLGYTNIRVFQVSGSCYEIYARAANGHRAEVYFNPVTGAVVQNNED